MNEWMCRFYLLNTKSCELWYYSRFSSSQPHSHKLLHKSNLTRQMLFLANQTNSNDARSHIDEFQKASAPHCCYGLKHMHTSKTTLQLQTRALLFFLKAWSLSWCTNRQAVHLAMLLFGEKSGETKRLKSAIASVRACEPEQLILAPLIYVILPHICWSSYHPPSEQSYNAAWQTLQRTEREEHAGYRVLMIFTLHLLHLRPLDSVMMIMMIMMIDVLNPQTSLFIS